MTRMMTREEFQTPTGKKLAWRSLMLDDHGFLRKIYNNTHQLSDKMWRTYQPSPKALAQWQARGIKTVINLRGARVGEKQDGLHLLEEETCAALGMDFVSFRAFSREAPSRDFIFGIKALFENIRYPAIMHCKSGADRAGIAALLYLFLHEQRPYKEALAQLTFKYGHMKRGRTGILDCFFEAYEQFAQKDGVVPSTPHFLDWVQTKYNKQELAASFKPAWLGSIATETLLRRE